MSNSRQVSARYGYDGAFIGTALALPSPWPGHHLSKGAAQPLLQHRIHISSRCILWRYLRVYHHRVMGCMITTMGGGALFMVGAASMLHGTMGLLYTLRRTCACWTSHWGDLHYNADLQYIAECSPALS